jgi:hypothetical protein
MRRGNCICWFLAIGVVMAAYAPASGQDPEERAAFCMGVLLEVTDYYRLHPESFPTPSRGNRIVAAVRKYERLLDKAGLLSPPTARSFDDVETSLQRQRSGRERQEACQDGIQGACRTTETCLQ